MNHTRINLVHLKKAITNSMFKTRSISKVFIAAGLVVMLTVSISSCGHKDGCPNKITEVAGVSINQTT